MREGMLPTELFFAFQRCLRGVEPRQNPSVVQPSWREVGPHCMPGRPRRGIKHRSARPTLTIWETRFGTQKGSRYWGVQTCSCCEQRHPVWRRRGDCGRPCHGSPTPSVLGRFSFNAPAPGVTTSSKQCSPGGRQVTRRAMMMACGGPWKGCSGDSLAASSRRWFVG